MKLLTGCLSAMMLMMLMFGSSALAHDEQQLVEIIVFGDSISDTGNLAPLPPLYFDGRFSNGPVWVERMADELGLPAPAASGFGGTNYAFGGAQTGAGFSALGGTPNIGTQVGLFLSGNTLDGDELIALSGGANDVFGLFFFGPFAGNDPVTAAVNLAGHVSDLAAAGGEVFVVMNLHALGTVHFGGTPLQGALDGWVAAYNSVLEVALNDLEAALGITILQLDAAGLFEEILADPGEFDLTNVIAPACPPSPQSFPFCAGVVTASDPDDFLLWDGVHVTAAAHEIIGEVGAELAEDLGDDDEDGDSDSDRDSD